MSVSTSKNIIDKSSSIIDEILIGSPGDDQLIGGFGNDYLDGGDGINELTGGEGSDQFFSGLTDPIVTSTGITDLGNGADSLYLSSWVTATVIKPWNADNNTVLVGERAGAGLWTRGYNVDVSQAVIEAGLQPRGFRIYNTSSKGAKLTGSVIQDWIEGGKGNDVLDDGGGNGLAETHDFLLGGAGNDTYIVHNSYDNISDSKGKDKIISYVDIVITTAIENITLVGEATSCVGGGWNNVIIGNNNGNYLDGGFGNDIITGGTGNDTLDGSFGNDVLNGGMGDDTLIGGYGNDIINGSIGNNTLDGGEGRDVLNGGIGNDTLIGGLGKDVLIGNGGDDTYIVSLSKKGTVEDKIIAGSGVDTLKITDGYFDFNYVVAKAKVKVFVAPAGIDIVDISESISTPMLGRYVVDLSKDNHPVPDYWIGLNVTGNKEDNTLIGNLGDNVLKGLAGNDIIKGGKGDDIIVGGIGNDILTGGLDNDIFLYDGKVENYESNVDIITDFTYLSVSRVVFESDQLWFSKSALPGHARKEHLSDAPEKFSSGTDNIAPNADVRFIYNTDTGELWYDQDGSGVKPPVLLEVLGTTSHPTITADFISIV